MSDEQANIEVALGDDDYWGDSSGAIDGVFDQMAAADYQGVWLGAPSSVALDTRETLPIIAYRGGSRAEVKAVSFDRLSALVAVDLDRNRIYATKAVFDPMGEPPPPSKRPVPKGYIVSSETIDARERLSLPWLPTRLLVTVLMRDHVSNRVEVGLGKSQRSYEDPAVADFVARERARLSPRAVVPAQRDPWPAYLPQERSPALPETAGVSLALERVVVERPNARCPIWGSFRLGAKPEELLDDDSPEPTGLLALDPRVGVDKPVAIVRITLVILAAETGNCLVFPMHVPSWDLGEDGHEVTGQFSFDLFAELREILTKPAQTWFVYAFSAEHMTAAMPFAIVPLGLI